MHFDQGSYDPAIDLKQALVETGGLPPEAPERPPLTITDHGVGRYFDTDAPTQKFLVDGKFPMGSTTLIVAQGGAGKGLLAVDLALKVASSPAGPFNDTYAFGGKVTTHGPVVYLSAEDAGDEMHRRVRANGRKPDLPCYIVPMPSFGGPRPIIRPAPTGASVTPEWRNLREQILAIKPVLVVFDPLASFCLADVNGDPAVGAYMHSQLTALAEETGACILMTHHVRKGGKILTGDDARESVRGSTALIDGARGCYNFWRTPESKAKDHAVVFGEEYDADAWWTGQLTKTNFRADKAENYFKRDQNGLLQDITARIRLAVSNDDGMMCNALAESIREAEERGEPMSHTGKNGLFERRNELPPELSTVAKAKLEKLGTRLLQNKTVIVKKQGKSATLHFPPSGKRQP